MAKSMFARRLEQSSNASGFSDSTAIPDTERYGAMHPVTSKQVGNAFLLPGPARQALRYPQMYDPLRLDSRHPDFASESGMRISYS